MNISRLAPVLAASAVGLLAFAACGSDPPTPTPKPAVAAQPGDAVMDKKDDAMAGDAMKKDGDAIMMTLPEQRFAAHFVDSVPAHGATFAAAPTRIVINFDFVLSNKSSASLTRDGQPVTLGAPEFPGDRKLTMQSVLPQGLSDGLYVVSYRACWPDGSCHDGQFGFTVDSKAAASYTDMMGKSEVQIEMKSVAFTPVSLVVTKGTKVTWTNRDAVVHFVNTDPHPTHNFQPDMNSFELGQGQTYSYMFSQPGEYPYHCSAHTSMTARVLVKG
jgi:plastocyanin